MSKIVLDSINVTGNLVEYHYTVSEQLLRFFRTDTMFIRYDVDMTSVPVSILTIPFVNCMAGLSWLSDSILFVDEIDETYYNAFHALKKAYNELHHYMGLQGLFVPSRIVKNTIEDTRGGILLFGGGVDCHTSFLQNRDSVSHILNIYGWAKSADECNEVDLSDAKLTLSYAQDMGVKALHATSNFASQFNLDKIDSTFGKDLRTSYWYGLLHSMAFTSIAAPLAWVMGVSNIFIASSFTKGKENVRCASYITTDSEFKFATSGKTIHDGFELSRQDKVAVIVGYQKHLGRPYNIQACSFNDHNCCECEKCFRTIMEIVAENGNPRDFGFTAFEDSLVRHWRKIVERDIALWGVHKESYYFGLAARKMKANYNRLSFENREFVDWFLAFDFKNEKRRALCGYYTKNFFSIIKRKLHIK